MKKTSYYFILAVVLTMISCSQDRQEIIDAVDESSTRSDELEIDYDALDTTYFVTMKDMEAYVRFKMLLAESSEEKLEVREILPLGPREDVTLCYVVNYDEGWEIIAADKRSPVVLAKNAYGEFKKEALPEGISCWLEVLMLEVLEVRECSYIKPEWPEKIQDQMVSNCVLWSAITAETEYVEKSFTVTRSHPVVSGRWQLMHTSSVLESVDTIGRLTHTSWYQTDPYNQYCPYLSLGGSARSNCGCSAVAAAQMVYFFHYKIGYPVTAPTNVYCNATYSNWNTSNYYTYGQSSTIWGSMCNDSVASTNNPSGYSAAAVLMSDVGIAMNLEYGNPATSADNDDVVSFFNNIGINCTQSSYDSETVSDLLLSGWPVVVSAKRNQVWIFPIYTNGHYFIIDRCCRTRMRYTMTYQWVGIDPEDPQNGAQMVEIDYSTPETSEITMNWGNDPGYCDYWFTLNGDWELDSDHNYQYLRRMITGYLH